MFDYTTKCLIYPASCSASDHKEQGKAVVYSPVGKYIVPEALLSLHSKGSYIEKTSKVNLNQEEKTKLAGYIAKQNLYHSPPELFLEDKSWLKTLPKKPDDPTEQANILLKGLAKLYPEKGNSISLNTNNDLMLQYLLKNTESKDSLDFLRKNNYLFLHALTYCSHEKEFSFLLYDSLKKSGDIEIINSYIGGEEVFKITMKGWRRAKELENKNPNANSKKAFIAMWFHESMKPLEKSIKTAAKQAGYKAYTIRDIKHSDKIDDKILSEIDKSKFVICDITSKAVDKPRASVFFEAGYAKGRDIPVIWTCDKSMKKAQSNAFDTRQYKCLFWDKNNMDSFIKELQEHIEKDDQIGKGPL